MSEVVFVIRAGVMASLVDVEALRACARGLDWNGVAGNLCRCGSYLKILAAVQLAAVEGV